jgi:L-methionine (R)-S-oxide reductase
MNDARVLMTRLRDTFSHVEFDGSLDDCLSELALMAGEILNAGCAIAMLTERQVAEIGLRPGTTEFGDVPDTRREATDIKSGCTGHDASVPGDDIQRGLVAAGVAADAQRGRRMFSVIVMQGKVIGVIRAYQPNGEYFFSTEDLHLFAILALVITKSIQVVQLQNILKSRFTQLAITRSSTKTVGEIVAESAQAPSQMARILAKSFYREMISAGFNFNQIIYAASEVISELTDNMRRHREAYKRRVGDSNVRALKTGPSAYSDAI